MAAIQKTRIEISTGTFIRALLLVLGVIFLYKIRDIMMIVLVSIVIASAVEPLVRWFIKWYVPRVLAVLLIYVTGIVGFIAIFYLLIPPVFSDFQNFFSQLPVLLEKALVELKFRAQFLPLDTVIGNLREAATNADQYIHTALSTFFSASESIFSGVVSFILIIVISFYLAVQEDGVANALQVVAPKEYERYVLHLWSRSQRKIGRWLQGQILLGLIVGVIVFIALTILQVPYALILSILSAIFEIIPYFGPIMAAIPAISVSAVHDPFLGLLVAGIYIVVQQMENHLIYPQVVRKTVGVPPLLAIIALLIGGKLAGVLGIIVSIPLAVVVVEYLNDVVEHKNAAQET